ncbi:SAM-dependent methyltransferase [Micromonospora avicenniae]|uniref:SAM-dependent methyltransferase n=1 Tax=Micromonospora avicenniae TaxID=1198245 RepID=UPI00331E59C6
MAAGAASTVDRQDLATCFAGLTMVEPDLVPIPLWRPDDADAKGIDAYGAVARKP